VGETQPQYPIGVVARRTGLSTHVLRAWERRYEVVTPTRSEGGARLYSDADVVRLRLLRRATEAGMPIGQAARLTTEELLALVRLPPDAVAGALAEPVRESVEHRPRAGSFVPPVLAAVEAMDGPRIHRTLMRAAVSLGAWEFTSGLAVPLLQQVGELWASGRLCPAHEHLFSVQLRRVLGWLLESLPVSSTAPGVVATTPAGETHELGAMLAAVVAAGEGWRVTFLGPDLPPTDIATAVRVTNAGVVLLSVVNTMASAVLLPHLRQLQGELAGEVVVLAGGSGSAVHREALSLSGAVWLPDLDSLAAMLRTLAPGTVESSAMHAVGEANG
jgi:MerR family transcriptional regulator, light-induced transcriptional regulator